MAYSLVFLEYKKFYCYKKHDCQHSNQEKESHLSNDAKNVVTKELLNIIDYCNKKKKNEIYYLYIQFHNIYENA